MIVTKRDIAEDALADLGFADYAYDIPSGLAERAVRKLDSMMGQWDSEGIKIGYAISDEPDLDDEVDIPSLAYNAIVVNLSIAMASGLGKEISLVQKGIAAETYNTLLGWALANPPERSINILPKGAGSKSSDFMSSTDSGPRMDESVPIL